MFDTQLFLDPVIRPYCIKYSIKVPSHLRLLHWYSHRHHYVFIFSYCPQSAGRVKIKNLTWSAHWPAKEQKRARCLAIYFQEENFLAIYFLAEYNARVLLAFSWTGRVLQQISFSPCLLIGQNEKQK